MDSGVSSDEHGWRKGPWTPEEDKLLSDYIGLHGDGRWTSVAKFSGLKRNGKSCRLRWVNYLRPGLKKGNLTPQEEGIIIELHAIWGNKWSTIARYLPGRTDNEIKNYWRTHFKIKSKPSQRHEKRKAEALRHQKHHHHTAENNKQNNCASTNNNDINQEMVFPYNENVMESHHPSPIINYHDDRGLSWSETIIGDDLWGSTLWNLDDQHYRAVDQGYNNQCNKTAAAQNSSSAYSFGAATGAAI